MALTKVKGSGLATGAATASLVGIDDNATSTAITIDASENVGIGTTSPAADAKAHIYSATPNVDALLVEKTSDDGNSALRVKHETAATSRTIAKFENYAGAVMTLDGAGNVMISKTTLSTQTVGTQILPTGIIQSTADDAVPLYLYRLTSDGAVVNFRKNTTAVGSISVTASTTAYNTSSDYRLKENVVPMTGSIDRLKDLKPSRFNFKADTDKTVDGFLAHEAGEVVPECATGTKDAMMDEEYEVTPAVMDGETVVTEAVMGTRSVPDYQGIDQAKLVPLLVASLQEAVAKIEALEARVTALEPTI